MLRNACCFEGKCEIRTVEIFQALIHYANRRKLSLSILRTAKGRAMNFETLLDFDALYRLIKKLDQPELPVDNRKYKSAER